MFRDLFKKIGDVEFVNRYKMYIANGYYCSGRSINIGDGETLSEDEVYKSVVELTEHTKYDKITLGRLENKVLMGVITHYRDNERIEEKYFEVETNDAYALLKYVGVNPEVLTLEQRGF